MGSQTSCRGKAQRLINNPIMVGLSLLLSESRKPEKSWIDCNDLGTPHLTFELASSERRKKGRCWCRKQSSRSILVENLEVQADFLKRAEEVMFLRQAK